MSDRDELIERLEEQTWIDEPFSGFTAPSGYRETSPAWPDERWETVLRTDVIESGERTVWFYQFTAIGPDPLQVPVGVVFETTDDARARVYYNKGLFGSSEPRRPLLAPSDSVVPQEVEAYIAAMRSGNREKLLSAVESSAQFQSPVGPVTGAQFVDNFARPGPGGVAGVPLEVCTVTTNGRRHAVEFISWRRPPHAGLSLYEFVSGKLVRMQLFEGPVRR